MMRFIGIFFLPVIWMALTGDFSAPNFALGFVLSSLVLWVNRPVRGSVPLLYYLRKSLLWAAFLLFFLRELVLASLRIAWDILTPRHRMRPAIVAIPLDLESDMEITSLANLITLTPGTLSLDISPDRKTLYIHAMYVTDVEKTRQEIKDRFERRIKELFR